MVREAGVQRGFLTAIQNIELPGFRQTEEF